MGKERASRERPQENQPPAFPAAHLAALIESTQDLIWSVDLNYRLVTFNKALSGAFARLYGANIAAGMTPRDLLPPERAAVFPPLYEKALREGPCSAEYQLADGRYLEMTFNPIIQDGRKAGVSVFGKDVTRQKSAEKALRRTADQYREIFEFAPEAIFRTTEEAKTLAINPAGAKLLGYDSPGEAIASLDGRKHRAWFDTAERSAFLETVNKNGEARSGPSQFKRKDGTLIWGIMTVRRICGPDGKTLYYQGFLEDVTERKAAEEALRKTEQQYRGIFENAPEGIFQIEPGGRLIAVNPAGAKIFGFESPEEARRATKGWTQELWTDQHDREACVEALEKQGAIDRYECWMKRRDGTPIWIAASARKITGPDGKALYYQGFMEDITEKKALEVDLGAKVRELRVLSELNDALLHAKTEEELLSEYCRIVVEVGGYRMAWVGFAEEGPEKRVTPVAHYGHEDGYLKIVNATWADTERGQGTTGRCIRTGEIAVVKDFAADPTTTPWREEALKCGYMSSIAIPFRHFEGNLACLTAYGVRASRWSDSERGLMDQVASALGFGITTLRTRLAKALYQENLSASLEQTIEVIAETVDQRDPYTAGHQRRVADLCVAIARKLDLSSEQTQGLRLAASIHDLGKIGIPAEILAKPGHLTEKPVQPPQGAPAAWL